LRAAPTVFRKLAEADPVDPYDGDLGSCEQSVREYEHQKGDHLE
jgi:hypothetical protein